MGASGSLCGAPPTRPMLLMLAAWPPPDDTSLIRSASASNAASPKHRRGSGSGGSEGTVAGIASRRCGSAGRYSEAALAGGRKLSEDLPCILASRRNFKGEGAAPKKTGDVKKNPADVAKPRRKHIQTCANFKTRYDLGREVMPSCHHGMKVLFGKKKGTDQRVVIKVREKRKSFKVGEEKGWRRSMELMLNLSLSGGVARLYEVLEDAKNYYVIMEECKGKDLFETIHSTQGKLLPEEVKEVLSQILNALAALHGQGFIHKDLKLENVVVDRRLPIASSVSTNSSSDKASRASKPLMAKLVDFDTLEEYDPKTPTAAKDVLGSNQYIAQEAFAGNYSFASDIFAVGVIAYRLLAGTFPFDAAMFNYGPGENFSGSPKMKETRRNLCRYDINWNHQAFTDQPHVVTLLKSMLSNDQNERPSAKEAIEHPGLRSAGPSVPGCRLVAPLPHCTFEPKCEDF